MRRLISRNAHPANFISAAWNHNRRAFSALCETRISDEVKQKFTNFATNQHSDPYANYMASQHESKTALQEIMPPDQQEILHDFGKKGRSVILLQNSPITANDAVPATPSTSTTSTKKDFVSELFMLAIAGIINAEPYLISGVRDGKVITQLIPTDAQSVSGSGSKKIFPLHNEVVHEPAVPDFFLLLCLRGNPLAKTNYCKIEDILPLLPPRILDELQQPNFLMKSGDKSVFKEAKEFRCPIITKDENGKFEMRLNLAPNRCEALTDDAKIALNYLSYCIENTIDIHQVALSQGEMLLINNKMTLHGRSDFDPGENPDERRWVQRMNLLTSKDNGNSRTH